MNIYPVLNEFGLALYCYYQEHIKGHTAVLPSFANDGLIVRGNNSGEPRRDSYLKLGG